VLVIRASVSSSGSRSRNLAVKRSGRAVLFPLKGLDKGKEGLIVTVVIALVGVVVMLNLPCISKVLATRDVYIFKRVSSF
jgi:hypothetical protein